MQDANVFDDMVAKLRATARFKAVRWGTFTGAWPSEGAYIHIMRMDFMNDDRNANNADELRVVRYKLTLGYTNASDELRNRRLMNYEAIILNTLHNKRLADLTHPRETRVTRGRDSDKTNGNTAEIVYDGTFAYRVNPTDGLTFEDT